MMALCHALELFGGWFCEHLLLMGTGSDGCRILMLKLAPTRLHF